MLRAYFVRLSALASEAADCKRILALEHFVDEDVTCLVKPRQMTGEISLGKIALFLEVKKINFGHRIQQSNDHQSCRLVNDAIEGHNLLEHRCHGEPPDSRGGIETA